MRHRNTELLLGYWMKLRGTRSVPARAEIDPRAIKRLLPDLFIIDRVQRNRFPFALAGTRLCWLYGRELREHNFLALWTGASERQVRDALDGALRGAAPAVIYAIAETADHRTLRVEILALPIADSRGNVTRLLCAMTPLDPIMSLGERKLTNQWVVSADLLKDGALPARPETPAEEERRDRNSGGGPGPGGGQPPRPRNGSPVPYLRLVVSRNETPGGAQHRVASPSGDGRISDPSPA